MAEDDPHPADGNEKPPADDDKKTKKGLRWRPVGVGLLLCVFVSLAVALVLWNRPVARQADPESDDVYVEGNYTPLSARVGGYVVDVPVTDNQLVSAGTVLAVIDDRDYRAAEARALAGLEQAKAAQAQAEAGIERQRVTLLADAALMRSQQAQAENAAIQRRRQAAVLGTAAGAASRFDVADSDAIRAAGQEDLAKARIETDRAALDAANALAAQRRAEVEAAEAGLRLARIRLGWTRIVAPVDGRLGVRTVFKGGLVQPGSRINTIVPTGQYWLTASFFETQLAKVQTGQAASVRIDALPEREIRGRVVAINPAAGAALATSGPANATGNFTKVVARIAVKIVPEAPDADLLARLRVGMSAHARIDTSSKPAVAP